MIRKRQPGDQYFRFEFRYKDQTFRGTFNEKFGLARLPANRGEAEIFAAEIKAKVIRGEWPPKEPEAPQVNPLEQFNVFFDQKYLPYCKENGTGWKHAESRGGKLKRFFEGLTFADITTMKIASMVNSLLQTDSGRGANYSPTTVSKFVQLGHEVVGLAIREKVFKGDNPFSRTQIPKAICKKIPQRKKRERYLNHDEERRLFEQLRGRRSHIYAIVMLALETGVRRGDIFNAEVSHVNLDTKSKFVMLPGGRREIKPDSLLVIKPKNGKPYLVPLSPTARQIVEAQINDATTKRYLFTSPRTGGKYTDIKTGFTAAVRDAGLEDFTFHDLKHTFMTRVSPHADPFTVRDTVGHSTVNMSGDYIHSDLERRRRAINLMSQERRRAQRVVKITA
jgi:integrase